MSAPGRFFEAARLSRACESNDLPASDGWRRRSFRAHALAHEREIRLLRCRVVVGKDFRISVPDENAAVTVSLPFRDELHFHADIVKALDAHRAEIALREFVKPEPLARAAERLAC